MASPRQVNPTLQDQKVQNAVSTEDQDDNDANKIITKIFIDDVPNVHVEFKHYETALRLISTALKVMEEDHKEIDCLLMQGRAMTDPLIHLAHDNVRGIIAVYTKVLALMADSANKEFAEAKQKNGSSSQTFNFFKMYPDQFKFPGGNKGIENTDDQIIHSRKL